MNLSQNLDQVYNQTISNGKKMQNNRQEFTYQKSIEN